MIGYEHSGFAALLPLLAFAVCLFVNRHNAADWRSYFVSAAVVWGVALVAITELLSVFERLSLVPLVILWVVFIAAVWVIGRRVSGSTEQVGAEAASPTADGGLTTSLTRFQVATVVVVLLLTLVVALLAAPSMADAMTYHLPRVEHWIQNRSVAPYPSNIQRQLWPGPGAEYVMLNFRLLSGSDRVITLVQWAAFAGNVLVASIVARQLGAGRRGQWFAAFLAACLPGAVAQASGSQVELVFAFWLACSVSAGLEIRKIRPAERWLAHALVFGGAIGLAVLAKATAFLYFAPFAIWFFIASLRSGGWRSIRLWVIAGIVALAVNGPHYYYNVSLYGTPLSEPGANGVVNSSFSVAGTVSNVVRNLTLHFGTPVDRVNSAVESAVIDFDARLGISPDDSRTTFPGERFHVTGTQAFEQTAGSPIHVLVAVGALVLLICAPRKRTPGLLPFMVCISIAFLLFCFYLRWQPWHARLHVPLLLLAASASALAVSNVKSRTLQWTVSVLAFVSALPALVRDPARPLLASPAVFQVPRQHQYFADYPDLYEPYAATAAHLADIRCSDIGLWVPGDAPEYLLWVMMRASSTGVVRIRHVSLDNPSKDLVRVPAGDNFTPCALLFIDSKGRFKPVPVPDGYSLSWEHEQMRVYTRQPATTQPSTTAIKPAPRSLSAISIASPAEIPIRVAIPTRSSVPSA